MTQSLIRTIVGENMGEIPHFLIYSILELVVIVLLLIDGVVSYVSNEFAKFFDLRTPCLICTRIDHVLVHRNSTFYCNDALCEAHKKDISSLAYCHVHKKLSDIRIMCDRCLLSYATEKDSDCDRFKSLVGILQKDIECFVEDDPKAFLKIKSGKKDEAMQVDMTGVSLCSCCGEPLKARVSSKFIQSASVNHTYAPTSSPRAPFLSWKNENAKNPELPHGHFTELKVTSDNDSELLEDEDVLNASIQSREDTKAVAVPLLPEPEDEEANRTPHFARGNRFFGIPLSDSAQNSPRYKFNKKTSLDRPEFLFEPNDLNDLDNDSVLNRMEKQARIDHKSLIALYMELDEERSASAVAANNAMAMITRLQAEKAAVQMEALQYQRMMEEQAEYDQEAIQLLKDLVLKREEEIRVLESELYAYREKYEPIRNIGSEICEIDDEDYQELKDQSPSPSYEGSETASQAEDDQIVLNERSLEAASKMDVSSPDFEKERSYLLEMLNALVGGFQSSEPDDMVKQEEQDTGKESKQVLARELSLFRERLRVIEADSGFLKQAAMTLQKSEEGTKLLSEIVQHLQNLRSTTNIIPPQDQDQDQDVPQDVSSLDFEKERSYLLELLKDLEEEFQSSEPDDMVKQEEQDTGNESKPVLARELSLFKERLRVIEADSGFLMHTATTLQKSDEGTRLLTEIAQHLRNLRSTSNVNTETAVWNRTREPIANSPKASPPRDQDKDQDQDQDQNQDQDVPQVTNVEESTVNAS